MGIPEIIAPRREAILSTAARYGVPHIKVFGSVDRGDARDDSDVDFLVEVVAPEGLHRLSNDRVLRETVPV